MATQPVPTFQPLTNPVPAIRRGLVRCKIAAQTRPPQPLQNAVPAARDRSEEKQQALVRMLPLVKRLAFQIREHLPAHVEVDDLLGNGVLGLVDAVAKFDTGKQVKFESYARHRVRGGILDGLRDADPASRDMRRKSKKIHQLYREMELKLGRPVTDEEISAALGLTLSQWHRTLHEIQSVGFDCGTRAISAGPTLRKASAEPELLTDPEAGPYELCYQREQREVLGRALMRLRERERQILTLYYYQELTMKQIADRLCVDESRVSQLHSAALVRLKAAVASMLQRRQTVTNPPHLTMAAGSAA